MRAQAAQSRCASSFEFGEIYLLANEYQLILISFQAINAQHELQITRTAGLGRLLILCGSMKRLAVPNLRNFRVHRKSASSHSA